MKTKKKGKKVVLIVLAVIAAAIIGLIAWGSATAKKAIAAMASGTTLGEVTKGDLQESVTVSGTICSENKKVVFSEVGGYIDQVNVKAGEEVKAGELLVSFQEDPAQESLQQATWQQAKSEAAYQKSLSGNSDGQGKLKEANVNLEVLAQQISDWENNINTMQSQLEESLRVTGNSLAGQISELSQKITKLQEELAQLDPGSEEYKKKKKQLAELQTQLAQLQLQQQTAGDSDYVAQMKAKIKKAQDELTAFKEYEAEMKNQKATGETKVLDAYDKKQLEVDNAMANWAFESAQKEYEKVCKGVTADFDGIVTECNLLPGAPVSQGMQMLTVESNKDLMVELAVAKGDYLKLEVGQKADVKFGDHVYEGTVSYIAHNAQVSATSGVAAAMVDVQIHIENPDDKLILGMDAKVEIFTHKTENALMIPLEALNTDKEGDFVYVVEDGIAVRKAVTCGITSGLSVEILEGLSMGEQIVIDSAMDLEDGKPVVVAPEKDAKTAN